MKGPDGKAIRIVVAGGGITGLAAAHCCVEIAACQSLPIDISVLEGAGRAGGLIETRRFGESIIECGADSFITVKPWALDLCRRLRLGERIIQTNREHRRTLVAWQGALHLLPEGFYLFAPSRFVPLLGSGLFSWTGKARMLLESVIPRSRQGQEETVAEFVVRRFGRQMYERVAQPMVGGIYTGDPARLSLKATLPQFLDMEEKEGSVTRALMCSQPVEASGVRYGMFVTLSGGLQELVNRLLELLPPGSLKLHHRVERIERAANGHGYTVALGGRESLSADAVILALPAYSSAAVLKALDRELASDLAKIDFASSVVLNLIYHARDVHLREPAFGLVVPQAEGRFVLAVSFGSIKFPHLAEPERLILRVFAGGALRADIPYLPDSQIEAGCLRDLKELLGITARPQACLLSRHRQAMPQYMLGHGETVSRIERRVSRSPGLALAGSSYHGVGIPDCIASGQDAAEAVMAAVSLGAQKGRAPEVICP